MATLHERPDQAVSTAPWWAYVAPMALFMALTLAEGAAGTANYVWLYAGKAAAVTIALVACRAAWRDLHPEFRAAAAGIVAGLVVLALWIATEQFVPYPHLGSRAAFDPFVSIAGDRQRLLFLITRFYGLALMVPLMEELFWRSFLIRYITTPRWRSIPPWAFNGQAFGLVAAGFALAHPEWLAALLCAAAYALLLRQTRSLFACVVAHAVTNLGLGIYVLATHSWRLW